MRKQILQIGLLLFLASGMLPCLAQTDEHPAAGKDFYFTLFNHWQYAPSYLYSPPKQGEADASNGIMQGEADATPTPMVCGLMINAVENADITFSSPVGTGDNSVHMNKGETLITTLRNPSNTILEAFEIHCTGSCFVNVWLQGSAGSAQSAILPTHLLGTDYVLQVLKADDPSLAAEYQLEVTEDMGFACRLSHSDKEIQFNKVVLDVGMPEDISEAEVVDETEGCSNFL